VLRGSDKVDWAVEQQKAFNDLKSYLEHLLTLSSLEQGQPLILYVSATHSAASEALVIEKENTHNNKTMKQQLPVYFMSEVLTRSKKFHSEMEKNLLRSHHEREEASAFISMHTQSKS
jgi:hypothetical protein